MAESITKAEIIKPENLVYKKTSLLTDKVLSYCPGLWSWYRPPDHHGSAG